MSEDLDPVLRLVEQIQAGVDREENFRKLYERCYYPVRKFFLRKGFSDDESRDLTQDTFHHVFRSIPSFRGDSRFEAWLYGLATNLYHNELRRRSSPKRDGAEVSLDADEIPGWSLDMPSPGGGALEQAIEKERRLALLSALHELPPQMRRCCILRYEKGLKYQEIAQAMEISIETVKAHLHQARKLLTAKLGGTP